MFQNIIALCFMAAVLLSSLKPVLADVTENIHSGISDNDDGKKLNTITNSFQEVAVNNEAMISFLPTVDIKAACPVQCNISMVNDKGEVIGYQPAMYVEKDTSNECYQEIMALTKSLIKGCKTDEEKARAIHTWVSQNIKYGVSIGMGNSIEQIYQVYQERSARCMGYSYLTGLMLYMAGIPNGSVISLGHMWNIALLDGKWIMIDSTWKTFDFSYHDDRHGKITMICFGDGNLCLVIDDPKEGVKLAGVGSRVLDRDDVEKVVIPDYVTQILNGSMSRCKNLKEVTIGAGVNMIIGQIFSQSDELKKLFIPPNVKTITDDALKGSGIKIICGYPNTEAQAYAKKYYYLFEDVEADSSSGKYDDEIDLKISSIIETEKGVEVRWNHIEGITEYTLFYRDPSEEYYQTVMTRDSEYCMIPYNKIQTGKAYGFYVVAFYGSKCMFESETIQYTLMKENTFSLAGTSIVGNIVPKQKGFAVKWKKQEAACGYQIQYSVSRKFVGKTTATELVKNKWVTRLTIRNLRGGKKYYVRIRTFQMTDGKMYFSNWSDSRSVVTK